MRKDDSQGQLIIDIRILILINKIYLDIKKTEYLITSSLYDIISKKGNYEIYIFRIV